MGIEQVCVDNIITDVRQIQKDYLAKEDYPGAAEAFESALYNRNYFLLDNHIALNLHLGMNFNGSVTCLLNALKKGEADKVPNLVRMVLAFGAQTHLPAGNPSERKI